MNIFKGVSRMFQVFRVVRGRLRGVLRFQGDSRLSKKNSKAVSREI